MIDTNIWNGDLITPLDSFAIPRGCFWTNHKQRSESNFLLFHKDNYFLKLFYYDGEITYSNYMKKYGIDYER